MLDCSRTQVGRLTLLLLFIYLVNSPVPAHGGVSNKCPLCALDDAGRLVTLFNYPVTIIPCNKGNIQGTGNVYNTYSCPSVETKDQKKRMWEVCYIATTLKRVLDSHKVKVAKESEYPACKYGVQLMSIFSMRPMYNKCPYQYKKWQIRENMIREWDEKHKATGSSPAPGVLTPADDKAESDEGKKKKKKEDAAVRPTPLEKPLKFHEENPSGVVMTTCSGVLNRLTPYHIDTPKKYRTHPKKDGPKTGIPCDKNLRFGDLIVDNPQNTGWYGNPFNNHGHVGMFFAWKASIVVS